MGGRWNLLTNNWWWLSISLNGGTPIRDFRIKGKSGYDRPESDQTFCIIRDPLDRLFHMWDCPNLRRTYWRTRFPTFEEFINHCCHGKDLEIHQKPQAWALEVMPSKLINFNYLHGELREIGITLPPHADFSLPGRPFYTDRMIEEMQPRYADDFALWDSVQ